MIGCETQGYEPEWWHLNDCAEGPEPQVLEGPENDVPEDI